MNNNSNNTQIKQSGWLRNAHIGLNLVALILSIMMSWHFIRGGTMIGCDGGSPCEQVLNSQWSVVAGLPVSGLAAGAYLALLIAYFFSGPFEELQIRRLAWKFMLVIAGSITGSAIWFTILQKVFIGAFCPYCMTTHITGVILSVLIILQATRETGPGKTDKLFSRSHIAGFALLGIVLSGVMAGSQMSFNKKILYEKGESQNSLPEVNYDKVPLVGLPGAPHKINLLFDYQCPHCQTLHFMLKDVVRHYEGKIAFALCPTPLNSECNPYVQPGSDAFKNSCELARIALALWDADEVAFSDFEDWMFTFDSGDRWTPRSLESAKIKAVELVGKERFDEAYADPWIDLYISKSVQMFGQTSQGGRGGIPKMIYGSQWVIPQPADVNDLIQIIQNTLGVPEPS